MKHRTKVDRESMRKSLADLNEKLNEWGDHFEKNPKAKRNYANEIFPKEERTSFTQDDLKGVLENFNDFHSISLIDNVAYVANAIFQMKWAIISPEDDEEEFITSDHPCVVFRPESIKKYGYMTPGSAPGLVYKDTELTLPLSSNMALMAGWNIKIEAYAPMPSTMINQINIRSTFYAQEKIIASRKEIVDQIQQDARGFKKNEAS
jgi:hypothetical protein